MHLINQYLTLLNNGAVAGSHKLLSSALKHIDNAVFSTIADVISGTFTSGAVRYGLNNGGVSQVRFSAKISLI